MNNNTSPPPGSDPVYKRLYAFARMVEDLLRRALTGALAVCFANCGRQPQSPPAAAHAGDAGSPITQI